jgi:hypothetical protein
MRSVTDELRERNPEMIAEKEAQLPAKLASEPAPQPMNPEAIAQAKLRVAMSTRNYRAAPKPTGVHFVSGKGDVKQAQMIFDDGSVRNPFKTNPELSGRQRRKMAKLANRNLKRAGDTRDIRDAFKGRQRVSQEVTPAEDIKPNIQG